MPAKVRPKRQTNLESELPSNREMINKIDNDITLLRGEVMELRELVKKLIEHQNSGWFFSK